MDADRACGALPHAADLAAEGPLLVVRETVQLQLVLPHKGLAAHVAMPRPLSFVASHVIVPAAVENALAWMEEATIQQNHTTVATKRMVSPQVQQRELSHYKCNEENELTTKVNWLTTKANWLTTRRTIHYQKRLTTKAAN